MFYAQGVNAEARKKWGMDLEAARKAAGLTQAELGKRVGGANAQTVSNWERGVNVPRNPVMRAKLARFARTPVPVVVRAPSTTEPDAAAERRNGDRRQGPLTEAEMQAARQAVGPQGQDAPEQEPPADAASSQ